MAGNLEFVFGGEETSRGRHGGRYGGRERGDSLHQRFDRPDRGDFFAVRQRHSGLGEPGPALLCGRLLRRGLGMDGRQDGAKASLDGVKNADQSRRTRRYRGQFRRD